MSQTKDTNPKDAVGVKKVAWSVIPLTVLWELGCAMLEGARKYGRHNYRIAGVRASVYFDACVARHLSAWWEGEDTDPDSGLNHITKAIATLVVLRDSMIQGNWVDDRPPKSPSGFLAEMNARAAAVIEKYPDAKPAYVAADMLYAEPVKTFDDILAEYELDKRVRELRAAGEDIVVLSPKTVAFVRGEPWNEDSGE
jgi:hypothetical protein